MRCCHLVRYSGTQPLRSWIVPREPMVANAAGGSTPLRAPSYAAHSAGSKLGRLPARSRRVEPESWPRKAAERLSECRKNGAAEVELAGAVELVGTMPTGAPEGGQIILFYVIISL